MLAVLGMLVLAGAVRPSVDEAAHHLEVAVGNESRRCVPGGVKSAIPAFQESTYPGIGCSKRYCVATTKMGTSAISAVINGVVMLNPGLATAKLAIYAGLHFSGAMMDWDSHDMCTYIISSIVTSCPRGEVKGSACKLGTQRRDNPYCEAVVASRRDEAEFSCAVQSWWDSCCNVREKTSSRFDSECDNCGQPDYFCAGMEG
mmetsp:Transcript_117071/g.278101  ORF Transcript_117071/g.278101 Transcript_117071/m.278101 type:complete len:202 (+) Transcript_117071:46-651(+)